MRWWVCAAVWIVGMTVSLVVAAKTRIGPMVIQLSHSHGVHVGDILAVAAAVLVGIVVTAVAWVTRPRPTPPSQPQPPAAERDRTPAGL